MALRICLLLAATAAIMADGLATDMGPAAFMWPPDREWHPDHDNNSPCGSIAGPSTRTNFPLVNGSIALVAQDDSYNMRLSISYSADPKSQSDFTTLIDTDRMREIDPGHTCVKIPDARAGTQAGDKATFQIIYIADFDKPENQTFYACTDVIFVADKPPAMFGTCFNATDPEDVPAPTGTGAPSVNPGHDEMPLPGSGSAADPGSNKLSGGAIAGIVVGVVVGVALLLVGAFFFYRERSQKKRLIRQRNSARIGTFGPDPADKVPKSSTSQNSIQLQNMEGGNA